MYKKLTTKTYKLKMEDGAPLFTQKNFKLINTFLRYDSNYNSVEDINASSFNDTYGGILLKYKEKFFEFKKIEDYSGEEEYIEKDILYLVIKSIDNMNSTHLSSQGQKGGNRGRIETAKGIYNILNFRERLYNADPKLVEEIAKFGGKNNFSFATKFCAYLCRYIFKGTKQEDNYCIYDEVVQSVLPYFAYKYKIKDWEKTYITYRMQNISIIKRLKEKSENSYSEYKTIVENIIKEIKKESRIEVTFEAFDHMLWYFFKGQPTKIKALMNKLPKKNRD